MSTAAKKRLVPHGYLADLLPADIELKADTVAEFINGVTTQYRGLDPVPGKGRHEISVDGFDTVDSLYEPTDVEEIHIRPDFSGAKGGFLKVLIGGALIASTLIVPGPQGVLSGTILGVSQTTVALVGASLALGGLTQILSPAPTLGGGGQEENESFTFSGKKNTVELGTRIPVIYGTHRFGGHYISFNIDAVEIGEEGEPLNQAVPPKPLSVSASKVQQDNSPNEDQVEITFELPSDSTIKDAQSEDEFGEPINPYPDGRNSIAHFVVFVDRRTQPRGPGGVQQRETVTLSDEVPVNSPITDTQTYIHSTVPYVGKFGVKIVYDNGDSSDTVWSAEIQADTNDPFTDPELDPMPNI